MSTSLSVRCALVAVATVFVPVAIALPALAAETPIYLDRAYSPTERAADLVSRLTLAEKATQMNSSQSAAIPRLGVAAYGWWNEAGHGVAREGTRNGGGPLTLTNTTSYPVDLSLGSTWNPDLVYREASMISDETRDVFSGNKYNLSLYSPTVNLARDPRWGRNDEAFSEDPVLTAALAAQFVNGLQGQTTQGEPLPESNGYRKAIATIKHFAANNSEYNRTSGTSNMDERTLREYYTAQFRDVIQQSNPGSIMSAYNRVNGIPASASVHLHDTLARQTFGFQGYFTSDCDGVYEIQAGHKWQPSIASAPLDEYGRTAFAQSAGEDLNCNAGYDDGRNYGTNIPTAVARNITTFTGVYNANDVDVSVVRLFAARIALGEFDAEAEVPWIAAARQRLAPGTNSSTVDANGTVTVSADVTNTGTAAGADVVQLHASTPDAAAALQRPKQRLAGFQKLTLGPNESKRVTFSVKVPDLAFFDQAAGAFKVDPGRYGIQVGTSSADSSAANWAYVTVTGTLTPKPQVVNARPVVAGDPAKGISQRVFFPAGSGIDPQLTVSMSDDTLAGYRTRGQSTSLPAGMTVTYASNRPAVVSADTSGLTARAAGVATVTATVTYQGATRTGTFPIYVQ